MSKKAKKGKKGKKSEKKEEVIIAKSWMKAYRRKFMPLPKYITVDNVVAQVKKNVIFDLDGTLSCDIHRRPLIEKKGWQAYFSMAHLDGPLDSSVKLFRMFTALGLDVHIITNRPWTFKAQTEVWLGMYDLVPKTLSMRDPRHYIEVGIQMLGGQSYDKLARAKALGLRPANVFMCLDDMDSSVKGWRDGGFDCWQVRDEGLVYKPKG